jgi:hypothetical protein
LKITVNIDCTPEEARAFFGLPDVRSMQERLVKEMEQRLSASLQAMSPESMLQSWMTGLRSLGELREKFFSDTAGEKKP